MVSTDDDEEAKNRMKEAANLAVGNESTMSAPTTAVPSPTMPNLEGRNTSVGAETVGLSSGTDSDSVKKSAILMSSNSTSKAMSGVAGAFAVSPNDTDHPKDHPKVDETAAAAVPATDPIRDNTLVEERLSALAESSILHNTESRESRPNIPDTTSSFGAHHPPPQTSQRGSERPIPDADFREDLEQQTSRVDTRTEIENEAAVGIPSLDSRSTTDYDNGTLPSGPSREDGDDARMLHTAADADLVEARLVSELEERRGQVATNNGGGNENENSGANAAAIFEAKMVTWKTFWLSSKGMAVVFIFLCALAGAVLAIVFGIRSSQNDNDNNENPSVFAPPVFTTTFSPTSVTRNAVPTLRPSTVVPTMAPTYALPALERLQLLLPTTTWNSINTDPTSHSAFAYEWLQNTTSNPFLDRLSDKRLLQRFVLACMYNATAGNAWVNSTGWLTDQHECDWYMPLSQSLENRWEDDNGSLSYGNSSCPDGNSLDVIILTANGLVGTLPPEIGLLSWLLAFEFTGNGLSGTFPEAISNMTALQSLDFAFNQHDGEIPTWIGKLSSLKVLLLAYNFGVQGTIPTELGLLRNLTALALDSMSLTGVLPSELGSCTNLYYLSAAYTGLTGSIPRSFQNLTSLAKLTLTGSRFEGAIDRSFWRAFGVSGKLISIGENGFNGTLATEVGLLRNVTDFYLSTNRFTGTLPTELGLLGNVQTLALETNSFSGSLPVELAGLTSMTTFYMSGNQLSGRINGSMFMGWSTSLSLLELHSNGLVGGLPPRVGLLTALTTLSLYGNRFNGTLPTELGLLSQLDRLDLSNNTLRGPLPTQLGKMEALSFLDLSDNNIQGPVNRSIWSGWRRLTDLRANGNLLSGRLESTIGSMTRLTRLELNSNRFSGTIPTEVGLLDQVFALYLENNTFTGKVPSELGLMSSLLFARLGGNPALNETLPKLVCDRIQATNMTLGLPCEINCTCGCTYCVASA